MNATAIAAAALLALAGGYTAVRQGTPKPTDKPGEAATAPPHAAAAKWGTPMTAPEAYRREIESNRVIGERLRSARERYLSGDLAGAETSLRTMLEETREPTYAADARRLLGRALADQARYEEALTYLIGAKGAARDPFTAALCYVRLGAPEKAGRYVSDDSILRYDRIERRDLPEARTPSGIEARVLIARGMNDFYRSSGMVQALRDFEEASRLDPRNPLAALYAARALARLHRRDEALPYLSIASRYGRGKIADEASRKLAGYGAR